MELPFACWRSVFFSVPGKQRSFPAAPEPSATGCRQAQRGRANGALFAGSRLGAAFSYPLIAWMLGLWSWRLAFLLLGLRRADLDRRLADLVPRRIPRNNECKVQHRKEPCAARMQSLPDHG